MFCVLYKWLISRRMDADKALPGLVARHLRKCPACKSFHENCLELAARLGEKAKDERVEVSSELHERIMSGLRGNWAETKVWTRMRPSWRVLVPAAAAAVLALAVIMMIQNDREPEPGSTFGAINTETIGWLIEVNAEKAVSIEEAVQGPIQEEIRLLADEGKAAAKFLLACLPLDMDALTGNNGS